MEVLYYVCSVSGLEPYQQFLSHFHWGSSLRHYLLFFVFLFRAFLCPRRKNFGYLGYRCSIFRSESSHVSFTKQLSNVMYIYGLHGIRQLPIVVGSVEVPLHGYVNGSIQCLKLMRCVKRECHPTYSVISGFVSDFNVYLGRRIVHDE